MKVILDEKLYDEIWNRIEKKYKFYPSANKKNKTFDFDMDNVCYKLKELTDINFIVEVLESNQVRI